MGYRLGLHCDRLIVLIGRDIGTLIHLRRGGQNKCCQKKMESEIEAGEGLLVRFDKILRFSYVFVQVQVGLVT